MLCGIRDLQVGAVLILVSSAVLGGNYLLQLIQFYRSSQLWQSQSLGLSGMVLVLAIIYMHGFSTSMDMMMVYRIPVFTIFYTIAGFLLPILLYYFSTQSLHKEDKKWIRIGTSIAALMALVGFLGVTRIVPFPVKLIFYSWVFLLLFYLVFLLKKWFSSHEAANKRESFRLLVITLLFVGFWIFRFILPSTLEDGLIKTLVHFGFVPILILPLAIISVKKLYSYAVFIFYFIFLDFYFIQFDLNFNYLVEVGTRGCVGYDQATDFPVNTDPGISLAELMKEPSREELDKILLEWKEKDFSPKGIEVIHKREMPGGDSLIVISHLVNGLKHYGAIRIPKHLDVQTAPILIELEGGGTGVDVSKITTLTRGKCRAQKDNFISILPSYRGCLLRGEDFCFRSQGYFGDPWLGPAEDAIALLEAVKSLYRKPDDTRVLANGISRGATVAMIMGGLTDKLDYIIATSTHTKFLDEHVVKNEIVGNSYARAFYTPTTSPEQIRKRIIASSSYYFADNLPPFDVHQGGVDELNTAWHANVLENRLQEIGKDSSTYNIFIYEDKGHGYDDDRVVCQALEKFIH